MDKMLFVVESNCSDPLKEDEFNEWYNKTHLPDVLETPDFSEPFDTKELPPPKGRRSTSPFTR